MQALLQAIATMPFPVDAQRIFHGRGGRFPGCEHLLLDAYPPVLVLTSFAELDAMSNRAAHLYRAAGLQTGDTLAIHMENHPLYFALVWGAQRAGLHYVCMSSRLTLTEARYIVEDSGAKLLVT